MRIKRKNILLVLRKFIYERDNYHCTNCFKPHEKMMPLQIHHINDDPLDNRKENLTSLCVSCHSKTKKYHRAYHQRITSGHNYLVQL